MKEKEKGVGPGFFLFFLTLPSFFFFFAKPRKGCTTGTFSPRSLHINQSFVLIEEKKPTYNQLQNR
jgi:hypothetical protein